MVVGSLHKNRAISLKEQPLFRERSMYLRSLRERCFWLPGIYLLMEISFYCCQKVSMSIAQIYERLNSTHAGVNSTACPSFKCSHFHSRILIFHLLNSKINIYMITKKGKIIAKEEKYIVLNKNTN